MLYSTSATDILLSQVVLVWLGLLNALPQHHQYQSLPSASRMFGPNSWSLPCLLSLPPSSACSSEDLAQLLQGNAPSPSSQSGIFCEPKEEGQVSPALSSLVSFESVLSFVLRLNLYKSVSGLNMQKATLGNCI